MSVRSETEKPGIKYIILYWGQFTTIENITKLTFRKQRVQAQEVTVHKISSVNLRKAFKADRLQMIVVAKKLSVLQLFISRMPKMYAILQLFNLVFKRDISK